ncbi:MAG: signal recognition particle protein, partial [Clostridia bacterium]|nr:signal recognition particle protein [Clostridia bacterium]
EKLDDLEYFHPDRMASRILGMGDMLSLIERAEQQYSDEEAEKMERKLRKNKFDMNDLLDNLQKVRKLGPLKDVLGMLPGVGGQLKDEDIDEHQFDRIQALILSMTPQEREKPDILDASRKRRIAAGAGQKVEDVNRLLAQYKQMQKMFKQMNSKKARKQLQRLTANGNMDGLKDLDITKLGM